MKGGESKALVQWALLFYGIKRLGRKTFGVVVLDELLSLGDGREIIIIFEKKSEKKGHVFSQWKYVH